MRDPSFYVSGLLNLHSVGDPAERRAIWRQSMATLARAAADDGPGPLDGLHPDALVKGVKAAISSGLVDDIDWLAPAAASAALYELAGALPPGPEQRDLGRRVLARLLAANAEAFTALATRMAQTTGKGLSSPAVRARIALVTELPIGLGVSDGALALTLVSRRELCREWIGVPSTRSLPARRLAARLLERAAREAARRASQGDDHAVRAFTNDAVSVAWKRLLGDRESLVWRHVATARGLLAPWSKDLRAQVEGSLAPELSPTEWRRGATSIAAMGAVSSDAARRLAMGALASRAYERDPGIASAFVWGIPRVAEAEPELASELLEYACDRNPAEIAEAVLDLRTEWGNAPFIDKVAQKVIDALGQTSNGPVALSATWGPKNAAAGKKDDGADAVRREVTRDLETTPRDDQPLRVQLAQALHKFHTEGARAAYSAGRELIDAATGEMDALEAVGRDDDDTDSRGGTLARRTSLAVLRDLDASLLERNVLSDLMRLGASENAKQHDEALDNVRERLSDWILARESAPSAGGDSPSHPTLRLRRLRALLHLVDSDFGDAEDSARSARLRQRWQRVARSLMLRFERDPPSMLRRTILAALARAFDALVRVGACDVADVLLVVARKMNDPGEFVTLSEASMDPDQVHVLARYALFVRSLASPMAIVDTEPGDSSPPLSGPSPSVDLHASKLRALEELARELAPDAAGRIEALRTVLVRLHAALSGVSSAMSLESLSSSDGSDPDAIIALEAALGSLTQLANGASARFDADRVSSGPASTTLTGGVGRGVSVAVSRVLAGAEPVLDPKIFGAAVEELTSGVPSAIARVVSGVLWKLIDLPTSRPSAVSVEIPVAAEQLPAWLPARRTLGGFYVLRGLGSGGVGSVFIVTRYEDRHDMAAERFALKVPDYSANAARSLSETEFLQLFRSEASALMQVPNHPNLARFVTFDLGSRPKPILVMELVEGSNLERVIETAAMDMGRCLQLLDDVLAGLEAMHGAGVGHLDLKPSNVVLRGGGDAVLVDFGLAGRNIRPGCATGPYGAPEVWGAIPDGVVPTPMAADVYAFGCLAFEALTGRVLLEANNELAQVSMHIAHDGLPPLLRELAKQAPLAPLVEILHATLRRDARLRPTVPTLRAALRKNMAKLSSLQWPGSHNL